MSQAQTVTVQVFPTAEELALMPVPFPEVQIGDPLTEAGYATLHPVERAALDALEAATNKIPVPRYGVGVSLELWREIKDAYDTAVALGLGHLCSVRRRALEFSLDPSIVIDVVFGTMSLGADIGLECSACGGGEDGYFLAGSLGAERD